MRKCSIRYLITSVERKSELMNTCMRINKVLKFAAGTFEKPRGMHVIGIQPPGGRATKSLRVFASSMYRSRWFSLPWFSLLPETWVAWLLNFASFIFDSFHSFAQLLCFRVSFPTNGACCLSAPCDTTLKTLEQFPWLLLLEFSLWKPCVLSLPLTSLSEI